MKNDEYETTEKTTDREEKKGMSFRKFNFCIALVGALMRMSLPRNLLFSEKANDPIPDDIRGNKKDGDEYDTIGDVLEKGGIRKVILIILAVLLAAYLLFPYIHFIITKEWIG